MENKYRNYTSRELIVMDVGRDHHDTELEEELCKRAGLISEWAGADGEKLEGVIQRAVKILSEAEGIRKFSFWAGI